MRQLKSIPELRLRDDVRGIMTAESLIEIAAEALAGRHRLRRPTLPCFEFNALLQTKRLHLLADVRRHIDAMGEGMGFSDLSSAVEAEALPEVAAQSNLVELRQCGRDLAAVERALSRITDGTYGYCLHCSVEIGRSTLKMAPAAGYCITCATRRQAV